MSSPLSFSSKILTASITLGSGTFDGKNNIKLISGLRMTVKIKKSGHPSKNECTIEIFGMPEGDMNKLATLSFKALKVAKNRIQVSAGDASGMAVAFQGEISDASADYGKAPDMGFQIKVVTGLYNSVAPSAPQSASGGSSVASTMQSLASQMGYGFENNGVSSQLHNQYLQGSAHEQAASVADAADCEFGVDDNVLFIAPRGQPRGGSVPIISAATGMKGYPKFTKKGIEIECLYNPSIRLGGLVQVQSSIAVACGRWRVNNLEHDLESLKPGGKWETKFKASWVGE
jgi:hypothetical protein